MGISSKVVQAIIDILLLAIPLTAISGAWLEGHPLTLPGNVGLGPLDTEAYDVGSTIASIHTLPGNAIPCVAVGMQPQPCTTIFSARWRAAIHAAGLIDGQIVGATCALTIHVGDFNYQSASTTP